MAVGTPDVIVVGAGFAGLAAATRLVAAGASVHVVEAQGRVGGKAYTVVDPEGRPLDLGAQAVNRQMGRVLALAERHGLTPVSLDVPGRRLAVVDGLGEEAGRRVLGAVEAAIEALADPDLKTARLLGRLGQSSVGDLITALAGGPAERSLARSMVEELWGVTPEEMAIHHFIETIDRYDSDADDWEMHFIEGLGALAERVAAGLGPRLDLRAPVERIAWSDGGVLVEGRGQNWPGRRVIVALPPTVVRRVTFAPEPPPAVAAALAGWIDGAMVKARLRYGRAFWRAAGLNGSAVFSEPSGMAVADTTDAEGAFPALTVFIGGRSGRRLAALDGDRRRRKLAEELGRGFGDEARAPAAYADQVWVDDAFSGGGYSAHLAPGAEPAAAEILRSGFGPVALAASELARTFPGFVEGALAAGEAAADAVLAAA